MFICPKRSGKTAMIELPLRCRWFRFCQVNDEEDWLEDRSEQTTGLLLSNGMLTAPNQFGWDEECEELTDSAIAQKMVSVDVEKGALIHESVAIK